MHESNGDPIVSKLVPDATAAHTDFRQFVKDVKYRPRPLIVFLTGTPPALNLEQGDKLRHLLQLTAHQVSGVSSGLTAELANQPRYTQLKFEFLTKTDRQDQRFLEELLRSSITREPYEIILIEPSENGLEPIGAWRFTGALSEVTGHDHKRDLTADYSSTSFFHSAYFIGAAHYNDAATVSEARILLKGLNAEALHTTDTP